jgi:hypothetical protein
LRPHCHLVCLLKVFNFQCSVHSPLPLPRCLACCAVSGSSKRGAWEDQTQAGKGRHKPKQTISSDKKQSGAPGRGRRAPVPFFKTPADHDLDFCCFRSWRPQLPLQQSDHSHTSITSSTSLL